MSVPLLVNAQFDPVTGRTGLASTPWNRAMLPLLSDLWVEVVDDLFAEMPAVAWDVVPLPGDEGEDSSRVVEKLESFLLDRARHELANRATIMVKSAATPLTELAVEDAALENVVTPDEIASLAGLAASLPASARDPGGRWRDVLGDWREAGAPLPPVVTIQTALTLAEDADRTPKATIALTAVALNAGLADEVAGLACVVTATGAHVVPPTEESLHALMVAVSPLAEHLGMGIGLAEEYRAETQDAQVVLAWLRGIGAVIDNPRSEAVVRRLAAAGQAGKRLDEPLTDDQLRALRDAFEDMSPKARDELGRAVGLAIAIAAFSYDEQGQTVRSHARPAETYLSRAIDREQDSFAVAAGKTTGLLWTHNRYASQLRSQLGRTAGLGPQKFLRLLGAESAPRLVPHADLYWRFTSESRQGLGLAVPGSPPQRAQAVRTLGASHTLSDVDSPHLRAVTVNIANEPDAEHRRARAAALLGALGRAWDRLEDQAHVVAAYDYYAWQFKGTVRAFWLWSAGSIKWLDNADGVAQVPLDLRLRTPATIAVHGPDAPGYLRPEFDSPNRRDVLAALGVSGEPSTRDLVDRLRDLRDAKPEPDTVATDAAIVYQAIADRLASRASVPRDLSPRDLHAAFDDEGLIHTNLGWRRPNQILRGPAVFRSRRAFVPQVRNTEALWNLLRVRQPSLKDCLDVTGQMARTRSAPGGDEIIVLLETLRLMTDRLEAAPDQPRAVSRRLSTMALWTTQGWRTDRPVYAVDDPTLVEGLSAEIPVWDPGGETSQFVSLLGPLRITALPSNAGNVVAPEAAIPDSDATELFGAAVSVLQEDLARNDPITAGALVVAWDRLREFEVRIDPDLRVCVDGLVGGRSVEIEVATKADVNRNVLFLRNIDLLTQVAAGGRAIAGLFSPADRRQLAKAWLAAAIQAEAGRKAELILLAEQQAAEDQARADRDIAERTAALGQEIAGRQRTQARRRPTRATSAATADSGETTETGEMPLPSPEPRPRVLVNPSTLTVINAGGRPSDGASRRPVRRIGRGSSTLPSPNRNVAPPRRGTAAPSFTPLDKETVGLELARFVLGDDAAEIVDLRAQHGVGADAIDDMDRFYELKVHLGDEPDTIHLEDSQIRRAMSTKDFFLVVVSNIEGANARPKVRIIVDPVRQLTMTRSSSVNFTGVRDAEHSLVYDLGPDPEAI
jgi:hypothetical protein